MKGIYQMHLNYQIKETDNYANINSVLINQFDISTRLLSTLIKKQCIMCNNQKVDSRNPVYLSSEKWTIL